MKAFILMSCLALAPAADSEVVPVEDSAAAAASAAVAEAVVASAAVAE